MDTIQENEKNRAVNSAVKCFSEEFGLNEIEDLKLLFQLRTHFDCLYSIGYKHGTMQSSHNKKVGQYKNGKLVFVYPSATVAARITGVHKSTVSKHCQSKVKISRKGSTFRYIADE